MPLDPEVRYTRAKDFESRVSSFEFPPEVWSTLSLLEQPSNAREVAAALLSPLPVAIQALERLLEAGLIQTKAIGWNEFAQRPTKSPIPVAARADGNAIIAIRLVPDVKPVPAAVSLRLASAPAKTSAPAGKTAAPAAAVAGWKLRPALDAIAASAGGGIPGQLLVCKIFLQLPADLLKTAGIESVSSISPDYRLTDARLRDTLVTAARTLASVDVAPFFV